ncbi:MAG TPA: cupin domain-containing protein [Solirubrobacterales bacterium]|nr:cupin domain-containing protein [Solirubrobacterales bacterium]
MLTESTTDPVHGARYAFEPRGQDLYVETWLAPGGGLPEHHHPVQEERWAVEAGRVSFRLAGEEREIGPEDGEILVRPGVKHALRNRGDAEVHLSCLVLPAGRLQEFLTDSAAAARAGLFAKGGIPKSVHGARWAAGFLKQHRDEVVMSFPPRFAQSAMIALLARDVEAPAAG